MEPPGSGESKPGKEAMRREGKGGDERAQAAQEEGARAERRRQRRKAGNAGDASKPGHANSLRVKYGGRGRAERAGQSEVQARSGVCEVEPVAAGGRCGPRGAGRRGTLESALTLRSARWRAH